MPDQRPKSDAPPAERQGRKEDRAEAPPRKPRPLDLGELDKVTGGHMPVRNLNSPFDEP